MAKLFTPIVRAVSRLTRAAVDVSPLAFGYDPGSSAQAFRATSAADSDARKQYVHMVNQLTHMFSWGVQYSRVQAFDDYRKILRDVTNTRSSLRVLVQFALTGATELNAADPQAIRMEYAENCRPEVRAVLEKLVATVPPGPFLKSMLKDALVYGNCYSQILYQRRGLRNFEIVGIVELPADQVMAVPGTAGKAAGYRIGLPGNAGVADNGILYSPVEILDASYERDWGNLYGTSILEAVRQVFVRATTAEDTLTVLLLNNAANRKNVALPVPGLSSQDQIEEWRSAYESDSLLDQVVDNNGRVVRQALAQIQTQERVYPYPQGQSAPTFHNEDPADLKQVLDLLRYYRDQYQIALGVPAALVTITDDVNARSTLEQQGIQFTKTILSLQELVIAVWNDLCSRAVAAAGLSHVPGEYSLRTPAIDRFDAEQRARAQRTLSETSKMLMELGVDQEWVLTQKMGIPAEQIVREPVGLGSGVHKFDPQADNPSRGNGLAGRPD